MTFLNSGIGYTLYKRGLGFLVVKYETGWDIPGKPDYHEILGPQAKYSLRIIPFYFFFLKEICSSQRIFFPVKTYYCLWNEMISCPKKLFPVQRNCFLSKKMISWNINWFPVKGNDFLVKELICGYGKLSPDKGNNFLVME